MACKQRSFDTLHAIHRMDHHLLHLHHPRLRLRLRPPRPHHFHLLHLLPWFLLRIPPQNLQNLHLLVLLDPRTILRPRCLLQAAVVRIPSLFLVHVSQKKNHYLPPQRTQLEELTLLNLLRMTFQYKIYCFLYF